MKYTVLFCLAVVPFCLTLSDIEEIQGNSRPRRQALFWNNQWTDKVMNYYYDDNLPLEIQAMFRDAFEYLSNHTCIKFKYDKEAENKVRIFLGNECMSRLQMDYGTQDLEMAFSCARFGVAVHETMHSLAVAHAQARSDRDDYLVVDSDNYNDFKKDTFNPVPFDYGSVMLYWRDEWRYPKDPEYNYTMGNLRVAFYDMIMLNTFYLCDCKGHEELKCENGGYQNPAKCDECLCTDGFTGRLCDKADGAVLEASTDWKVSGLRMPTRKGIEKNTMPEYQNFLITAPEGSTIEVRVTKLSGFFCHETCDWNGVELKYKEDRRITSPLLCCDNDNLWNKTRSSTNNPFVVVKYGDNRTPHFEFEYRYIPKK